MKKFNSYVNITNELIEKRGLEYSHTLFCNTLEEVKNTPKYVKLVQQTIKTIDDNKTNQKYRLWSFMDNNLTTDNRLK